VFTKLILALTLVVVGATPAIAAPKIATNAGVRTLASVENRGVLARGSVFEVNGEALGPEDAAVADVPHPVTLAEVTVTLISTVDSSVVVSAFIIAANATRLVAIVPSSASDGDYAVTTSFNAETSSNSFPVKIASSNFGPVTNIGSFGGMALGRILADGADPVTISLSNSITPGATLEMDATGLGPLDIADNDFPVEANLFPEAVLLIGELQVPVTYVGRNPLKPGFDRIVVTLPSEGVPSGCVVPARIQIGEVVTLMFSLPILGPDETSCRHPLGLTPEGLTVVSNGGSIVRGGFTLVHLVGQSSAGGQVFESSGDQISGGFVRYTAEELARVAAAGIIANVYDADGCTIYDAITGTSSGQYVDAGPSVSLVDPGWRLDIPRGSAESLNQYNLTLNLLLNGSPVPGLNTPRLMFAPGRHTIEGPGGEVVGPFSIDIDISNPMQWTNMSDIREVDTSKDLTLTFSGAGPDDEVIATASVKGPAPEAPARIVTRVWLCKTKGAAGKIVVKSSLLQKMPKVSATELATPSLGRSSSLTVGSYSPTGMGEFRAPLTNGGITEIAVFLFNYTHSKAPVPVR
jgi:uncharacterized protein (TIGR03437 family)